MEKIILGIDEVGRGPWAGPLVVGAVVLGPDFSNPESSTYPTWQALADSKKLTAKKRTQLSQTILKSAAATGIGWVSAAEIDQYGLSASLKLATRRAVKQILATKTQFDLIIIDGTINFLSNTPLADRVTTLKKADSLVKPVSAASIIAKVARDQYMTDLAATYPEYGFESHVGYGTLKHREVIQKYGICPEHRLSFRPIKEFSAQSASSQQTKNCCIFYNTNRGTDPSKNCCKNYNENSNSTTAGHLAENAVAKFLATQNHRIIRQNAKTRFYEIDLISVQDHKIYFTEVKYHHDPTQSNRPIERITPDKQRQMIFAAQAFLAANPQYKSYEPQLAVASVLGSDYQIHCWLPLD